jgi:hypothetical protein
MDLSEALRESCIKDTKTCHPCAGAASADKAKPPAWSAEAVWQLAAAENIVRAQLDQEAGATLSWAELRSYQLQANGADADALG